MNVFKCQICSHEVELRKFVKLKASWKCQCGAAKSKFKRTEDLFDQVKKVLKKYRAGTKEVFGTED